MRWKNRRQSTNVDDRRGRGRTVRRGIGIGTIVIAIIYALITGKLPTQFLQQAAQTPTRQTTAPAGTKQHEEMASFVKVVLKDTEDVWDKLFAQELNRRYKYPTLVLYDGVTDAACGTANAAVGPFYCPADEKIYLDLSFFQDLKNKLGAGGDFAVAYVVAHEVAHHVQKLLGITRKVAELRPRLSKKEYNRLSVRLELQADYLAGVWAHHVQRDKQVLEEGDVQEAIGAAAAVGDDRLQKRARGQVVPDAFTHGTSEQRVRWFMKGFKNGTVRDGNTFEIPYEEL